MADRRGDLGEPGRPGRPVDQGEPVQQRGRADRSDDQVLEPGLERARPVELGRAEDVQGDREELETDEQGDEVGRADQDQHAGHRSEQERVVLAVGRLPGGERPPREERRRDPGGRDHERQDQRQAVDRHRPGDDRLVVVPLPDRQADRHEQRDQRGQRDELVADLPGSEQAEHEHDERPGEEGLDRAERGEVDVRPLQGERAVVGERGDVHLIVTVTSLADAWTARPGTRGAEETQPVWAGLPTAAVRAASASAPLGPPATCGARAAIAWAAATDPLDRLLGPAELDLGVQREEQDRRDERRQHEAVDRPQLPRLDVRPGPVVHRADVHPQGVDRRHHDAGEGDDREHELGREEPQQDQELTGEVARPRHRQGGERDDQEERREDRRPRRDPAHLADVLRPAGTGREQGDDEEQRRDDQARG